MEVDDWVLGNAGDARAATPISTQCPYHHPLASIHMDANTAMEFDTLKVMPQNAPPHGPVRELTAPDLVNCFT